MEQRDFDETRATGHLPHLDIEIVHRRARHDDAEQISISLRATPSLTAFAEFLESANPMLMWMRMWQIAWTPWLALPRPAGKRKDG